MARTVPSAISTGVPAAKLCAGVVQESMSLAKLESFAHRAVHSSFAISEALMADARKAARALSTLVTSPTRIAARRAIAPSATALIATGAKSVAAAHAQ